MNVFQVPRWIELIDDPIARQIREPDEADEKRQDAERAEQMLRPLVEAGEEIDGEQIEEALNDPRDAVF